MWRVRRPHSLFLRLVDRPVLDLAAMLRGETRVESRPQWMALSSLTGEESPVGDDARRLLEAVPADRWSPADAVAERAEVTLETVEEALAQGWLVSDRDVPEEAERRRLDDGLVTHHWHPFAAFYHFQTRWRDLHRRIEIPDDVEGLEQFFADDPERYEGYIADHGQPPPTFHRRPDAEAAVELPAGRPAGGLYRALAQRRTFRLFETQRPLPLEAFAVLLRQVFGARGMARLGRGMTALQKTSPSAGALHPVEVYPLVRNVEGVESGLYHYEVEAHRLGRLRTLSEEEAEALAVECAAGQTYAAGAHVLFLLTARFPRNFWKYDGNPRTYGVVLMDAAHLSQTCYLVATELGLGTFYTAAINAANVDDLLGLDPAAEGALALLGCGWPLIDSSGLALPAEPFEPRRG